jgi:Rieske Fe-S protein
MLSACGADRNTSTAETPLIPLDLYNSAMGVVPWRAPLAIRDSQLQLAEYDPTGDRQMRTYDELTFPTDVLISFSESMETVTVFLRRSPHGGCLLQWDPAESVIIDPCFGSKFDRSGGYISGPSPRNLDRLEASVRDGMIWVGSEIIYGDARP